MMSPQEQDELLEIVRMGDPVLREIAQPLPTHVLGTPEFQRFSQQMIATMLDASGVGIAAPQVAEGLRCFAYCVPGPEGIAVPPRVLVNPEIRIETGAEVQDWEGCLSIPGFRGSVPRPAHIEVSALTPSGERIEFEAKNFEARVILHENDHLDGILFLDRMSDFSSLSFEEEWAHFVLGMPWNEIYIDEEEE